MPGRCSETEMEAPTRFDESTVNSSKSPLRFSAVLIPPPSGERNVMEIELSLPSQNPLDKPSQSSDLLVKRSRGVEWMLSVPPYIPIIAV